jgi:hypothetical protein
VVWDQWFREFGGPPHIPRHVQIWILIAVGLIHCRGDYIPEPIMKKARRGPIAAVCLRALYLLEGSITDGGLEYLLGVRH